MVELSKLHFFSFRLYILLKLDIVSSVESRIKVTHIMIGNFQVLKSINPIQTDGFDFIEFATKSSQQLLNIFTKLGFVLTHRHRSQNILLLEQGEIKFVVNAESGTDASAFEAVHGSGICGISFRVENSDFALKEAVKRGAKAVICDDYGLPAIEGVGDSKLYLIDRQTS